MDRVGIETLDPKLEMEETMSVAVLNAPADYWERIGRSPSDFMIRQPSYGRLDFIHLFAVNKKMLEQQLRQWIYLLKPAGMIWVSWPEKSSEFISDLDEQVIREMAGKINLVGVKICSYDETWRAIKLVIMKEKSGWHKGLGHHGHGRGSSFTHLWKGFLSKSRS
ncbi:DUF3052 domain-containing protein [Candidatus Formimonas warabiya]|uniref:DUF3052 domain-containing protein n=1 Tax=Formimonas warabiya TaxID=1761012 RepID=A0A3G1KXE0_FORW1|nr:DUF3052 domain-containing protein [Candidatus Formimonas warabiya]ATW27090.1 hypothetical protein DCMF_22135 [Candidatus Formimonas warabiya]